jgi:hypothetical protein
LNDASKPQTARAANLAFFILRHAIASFATIVAACLLWTVAYFALLLWAVAANAGLGGPLAYPGMLLVVAVAAIFASTLLFFPATALAEWVCSRARWPVLAQIPVTVGMLAMLCITMAAIFPALRGQPISADAVITGGAWFFGLSLLPIGIYWWIAQAGPLLRGAARHIPRFGTDSANVAEG